MKLVKAPYGLENKVVAKGELARYFDADSLEELIFALHEGARARYFDFDATLSPKFLDLEEANLNLRMRTDVFISYDPFGTMRRSEYELDSLKPKIRSNSPLNRTELEKVRTKLPRDLAERYLRFKLSNFDRKKLEEIIAREHSLNFIEDEDFEALEYSGLRAEGAEISYLGEPIDMSFQQREVVRVFLGRPEQLLSDDVFTDNQDVFKSNKVYPDQHKTLSKLISEVNRKLLHATSRQYIHNEPKEGWRMQIG